MIHALAARDQTRITGILLAAGGSSRLRQPKQLLIWQGKPLILHAILQLQAAGCDSLIVVSGPHGMVCRQMCDDYFAAVESPTAESPAAQLIWVNNADWKAGQSGSLRLALQTLVASSQDAAGFLVALCDQPLMQPEHYRRLMDAIALGHHRASATAYAEGGGVPACFRQDCLPELLGQAGDSGAKSWIRRQPSHQVALFDFGSAVQDIDTEEDHAKLKRI